MENIEFNPGDQKYKSEADFARPRESAMVKLVMKLSGGAIRDEKQANYVLMGIAVLFFIATFFVISGTFGGPKGNTI